MATKHSLTPRLSSFEAWALALGGIVVALWKVARARPAPPTGPLVLRSDAPELWGVVDEVAALAGTAGSSVTTRASVRKREVMRFVVIYIASFPSCFFKYPNIR